MTADRDQRESQRSFEKGRAAFDEEDWVLAIRSFLDSIREDPQHVRSYIALVKAYEAAAEEFGDPDLLDQASRVCRDAIKLPLGEKDRAFIDAAADRIEASLRDLAGED